jgi:plastocyanin
MHGMGSTHPPAGVVLPLFAVIAALLVGCGGDNGDAGRTATDSESASASSNNSGTKAVTIRDYTYEPATITVPQGTTVTFTNRDSTPHTATSKQSGLFESGSLDTGKSGTVTFDETGNFAYYCLFHPFMKGTITVE